MVGLFFATLTAIFAGNIANSPHAFAQGEYYQYLPQPPGDDTIRVTGGWAEKAAGLHRIGPTKFEGGITILGANSRVNGGTAASTVPCQYTITVTIDGDITQPIPGTDGSRKGTVDFNNGNMEGDLNAPAAGHCKWGDSIVGGTDTVSKGYGTDVIVHLEADPRGPSGGNACPGSNAPPGTKCDSIPVGCPGATPKSPPAATPPAPCQFQAVAATDETEEPDLCPVESGTALRWLACPIIDGGAALTNGLDSIINYFLTINTVQIYGNTQGEISNPGDPGSNTSSSGFYKAWTSFRNLGLGLVVIAGIIMVMSEALGLQIVDAYTIRKVLPRLLIAVIGISLSWSFMYFMVTLFNNLGTGMASLIYSSFEGVSTVSKGTGTAAIFATYFGQGGGLLALGFLGVLSFLGTLILALVVGIAVLIFREGIILMCIIIAPLAIASYVLPNTSKFASFWWDAFFKALIAFPIITGFIAICKVMAAISGNIK